MDTLEKIDILDAKVKTAVRLIVSLREEKNTLLDRLEKILDERDTLFEEKEQLIKEKLQFESIRKTLESEKDEISVLCQEFELKNKDLEIQVNTFRDRVSDLEKRSSDIVDDNSLIESGIQDAIDRLDEIEKGEGFIDSPNNKPIIEMTVDAPPIESSVDSSIKEAAESSFEGIVSAESSAKESQNLNSFDENKKVVADVGRNEEIAREERSLGEPSVDVAIEEVSSVNSYDDDSPRELFDSSEEEDDYSNDGENQTESYSEGDDEPDRARELFQSRDDEFDEEVEEEPESDFFQASQESSISETFDSNAYREGNTENQSRIVGEASVDVPIESIEPSSTDSLEIF